MNTPIKHRILFIVLISVIGYSVFQKGLMCLYPIPEKTSLMTKDEYKKIIQKNFPQVAPALIIAGSIALITAYFVPHILFTPVLYIVGSLWFFKGYTTMNWGAYDQIMQFLFTIIILGLLCYWALGASSKKKRLSNSTDR